VDFNVAPDKREAEVAAGDAAKVPTKLLFPLIFCVFPSIMLVLLGPAFIAISRTLLPTLGGN